MWVPSDTSGPDTPLNRVLPESLILDVATASLMGLSVSALTRGAMRLPAHANLGSEGPWTGAQEPQCRLQSATLWPQPVDSGQGAEPDNVSTAWREA